MERRLFAKAESHKERLLEEAQTLRDEARLLPYGPLRDAVLKEARQTEAGSTDDWLNSRGLPPPEKDETPAR